MDADELLSPSWCRTRPDRLGHTVQAMRVVSVRWPIPPKLIEWTAWLTIKLHELWESRFRSFHYHGNLRRSVAARGQAKAHLHWAGYKSQQQSLCVLEHDQHVAKDHTYHRCQQRVSSAHPGYVYFAREARWLRWKPHGRDAELMTLA